MNRSGLGRFGVAARTVVRSPVTDHDNIQICGECGHPVANSLGSQEVAHPTVIEGADPEAVGDVLVTHGWVCDRHSGYEVVMPTRVGPDDASARRALTDGWTTVRVRIADGSGRWVPTPRAELEAAQEVRR